MGLQRVRGRPLDWEQRAVLQHTRSCIKLNLVNHFNIDDQALRNFLGALQSGYHPNPYHNATHAADVTQINYFIITTGGLAERCQLSKEDLLGAMIAGAHHDYDHPGFNNNFHTRTNAYLPDTVQRPVDPGEPPLCLCE